MVNITLNIEKLVPRTKLADVLCAGLEGGFNYWGAIVREGRQAPPQFYYRTDDTEIFEHIDFPINDGGHITIVEYYDDYDDTEGVKPHILNVEKLYAGVVVMMEKYPHHLVSILSDNFDAETGDVLIQCAVFGELVYG